MSSTARDGYASKARDMFPDLDYRGYMNDPSPSTIRSVKEFVDELLWKYTSVLMAQPFEVAKTVLQVRLQDDVERLATAAAAVVEDQRARIASPTEPAFEPYDESPEIKKKPELPPHQLNLRRPDSIFDVIAQLWSKESAWGVWKGSNATFLYTVLQSLLENWSRSLLSALLNVPDLGVKDDVDRLIDIASPYPWASLCVAASAAVATGLILAPLICAHTIDPHPHGQRLAEDHCDPASPAIFCTSCVSLFVKLPLETVLRRGQAAVLRNQEHVRALEESGKMETIVEPGPYYGVLGTMYSITTEEGTHAVPVVTKNVKGKKVKQPNPAEVVYKKGQGMEGLWRGYKVSWWGLLGLWTASVVGGGGEGAFW
ncbi:mitochondrial carrier domain-containing protein [Apiospora marii]|uniref:Mitochondrial carrier domain-containing protein n=1 Tax=Apiospora marii TaxID=335849 RepID=A0ABR1R7F0_9PEZI